NRGNGGRTDRRLDRGCQPACQYVVVLASPGSSPGAGCSGTHDRLRAGLEELRLMAKINLLPWRAERRKQRQQQFYTVLAVVGIAAVLAVFGIKLYFDSLIEAQQARNTYLQTEITEVDKKIKEIEALDKKRADLLQRKQVIE